MFFFHLKISLIAMDTVLTSKISLTLISGFRRDVDVMCGLLGNYTASLNNYHTTPCNYPEDHRLQNQFSITQKCVEGTVSLL